MTPRRTLFAFVADQHCGSTVGLMPLTWEKLDGNTVAQNAAQQVVWEQWLEQWETLNGLRKKRDRLIVVNVGDAVEGVHHGTTQLITTRLDEQERIHIACMEKALELVHFDRSTDELWYIAGTAAHVGPGASAEENIVRTLLGIPAGEGVRQVHYHLRRRVNGVLVDVAHQGPTIGSRVWLRGNQLQAYLRDYYFECLENGQAIPRYVIRAHRHQFVPATWYRCDGGVAIDGYVLPANTLKGEFASAIVPKALAHVGMVIVGVEPDGSTWQRVELLRYQQEAVIDDAEQEPGAITVS